MFTEKELKAFKLKLQGLMNKEIAKSMNVSESDISQTLSRLRRKIVTVQDSIALLTDMGVIREGAKYVLTEKGRAATEVPPKKAGVKWAKTPLGESFHVFWNVIVAPYPRMIRVHTRKTCFFKERRLDYELSEIREEKEARFIGKHLISNPVNIQSGG